jgi:hypothetical protein
MREMINAEGLRSNLTVAGIKYSRSRRSVLDLKINELATKAVVPKNGCKIGNPFAPGRSLH